MTTRQEATQHAIRWAKEAETRHRTAPPAETIATAAIADTWTRIARLLPAVLTDQQLEQHATPHQCCQLCPCTGAKGQAACNPCCACGKQRTTSPQVEQCRSRHEDHDGLHQCERQAGHHGIHTKAGRQWPNHTQPNATPATGDTGNQRHPDCLVETCHNPHCGDHCAGRVRPGSPLIASFFTKVPGQRPAADDQPPRCPSRLEGEQCERAAGHSGIHQGTTCGWRNEPAEPPAPATGLCCQRAVIQAAKQLLEHARIAPGLTALERRAIEDAADFVRSHLPAAVPELPMHCDRAMVGDPHPAHTFMSRHCGQARCPGSPS